MKKSIENLQSNFAESLLDANSGETELHRLNAINKLCEQTITELREILKHHPFENSQEEIEFFKNVNPQFLSPPIEEGIKYNILTNKPISTKELLVYYFEDALKSLQSFFAMNNFHYQYYKNHFRELDTVYFLRNAEAPTIPIIEIPSHIKEFCPPMSYLFAKFIAYENVQHSIIEQIDSLRMAASITSGQNLPDDGIEIKWTGDVINVIELAYGLWLTGQINNGNASLNQIVRWLEKNLSVSIGIAQRKFSEISRRKRISITKYLDQMKDAIIRKINSGFD